MAVINIGSGSVKLYLCKTQKTEAKVTLFASFAENNDRTAFENTFNAVAFFYHKAKSLGEPVYIFGTQAMRVAGVALSERIFKELGCKVDIISGETEALCGFLGCTSGQESAVIDVGGASTEMSSGNNKPEFCLSLPLGAATLFNRFKVINAGEKDMGMGAYAKDLLPCAKNKDIYTYAESTTAEINTGIEINKSATAGIATAAKADSMAKINTGTNAESTIEIKDTDTNKFAKRTMPRGFFNDLYGYIDDALTALSEQNFSPIHEIRLIGGTALNLAAILKSQTVFDAKALDKSVISVGVLPAVIEDLFSLTLLQRIQKYPFLEEKRALILPYGISIIYRLLSMLPPKPAFVSREGLIEGYIKFKGLSFDSAKLS